MKKCSRCGETKPRSEFNKRLASKDGLRGYCRECGSEYYAANREYRCEQQRKWRKNNPDKRNAIRAKHRARKLQASPKWADLDAIRSFYEDAKELESMTGVKWHVDHIVPLKHKLVCGLHVEFNLQLLTESENCAKSNYWELEACMEQ